MASFTFSCSCWSTLLGAMLSGKSRRETQLPTRKALIIESYSLFVNSYSIDESEGTS